MIKVILNKEFIEEHLARKNISQNAFAIRLGISSAYISQLISGTRKPSPKLREKILKIFGESNFDKIFILKRNK